MTPFTAKNLLGLALLSAIQISQATQEVKAPGYSALRSIKVFAFGGVGFAARTSEGELEYRKVAKSPKAGKLFLALVQDPKATPAARLYALVGLRESHRPEFVREIQKWKGNQDKVVSQAGCIQMTQPFESIRINVVNGEFHPRLK